MAEASDFIYDPVSWSVTPAVREAYEANGYILVRNMLTKEEVQKVRRAVDSSKGIMRHVFGRDDGIGRVTKQCIWNHPGRDLSGILPRLKRVAGTMEQLMGGDEIYHYHSKVTMKDPHTGGAFPWHQDYGYWYKNGNLHPDMGTVFIPLDDTTRENGCLQILRGSHRMGRLDHVSVGQQLGADPERVEQANKVLEHLYVEMEAGDMLFFHCNLLHTSDQNISDRRRWAFVSCFNKRSNDPYMDHHHPRYTPMAQLEDCALMECDEGEDLEGKWFMRVEEDHSTGREERTSISTKNR